VKPEGLVAAARHDPIAPGVEEDVPAELELVALAWCCRPVVTVRYSVPVASAVVQGSAVVVLLAAQRAVDGDPYGRAVPLAVEHIPVPRRVT
jgi:hypothetical protein